MDNIYYYFKYQHFDLIQLLLYSCSFCCKIVPAIRVMSFGKVKSTATLTRNIFVVRVRLNVTINTFYDRLCQIKMLYCSKLYNF